METDGCVQYHCPECGEHVALLGGKKLIGLHRSPDDGKRCDATGRSLVHYRWVELFKAITGNEPVL
jgi:hypothetical protein